VQGPTLLGARAAFGEENARAVGIVHLPRPPRLLRRRSALPVKLKALLLEPGSVAAQVPHDRLIPVPAAAPEKIIRVVSHSRSESRKLAFRLPFRFWKPPPRGEDSSKRSFLLHVLFVHPHGREGKT
jgi:hypothetical protein